MRRRNRKGYYNTNQDKNPKFGKYVPKETQQNTNQDSASSTSSTSTQNNNEVKEKFNSPKITQIVPEGQTSEPFVENTNQNQKIISGDQNN